MNSVIRENLIERVINNISERVSSDIKDFSEYVAKCLTRPDESMKVPLDGLELFFSQKGIPKKINFILNHILFPPLDFMEKEYNISKFNKKIYFYYLLRPFFLAGKFTWRRTVMAYRITKIKDQK